MAWAKVGDDWQEISGGATVTDVETIWDLCGCMGLCPACRGQGKMRHEGCMARYVYGRATPTGSWSFRTAGSSTRAR